MIKNLVFKFLSKNDIGDFLKILKLYRKNHFLIKNKKYFNWRFKNKNFLNIVILKYKKQIISFLSFYTLKHYDNCLKSKFLFLSLAFSNKNLIPGQFFLLLKFLIKRKNPQCILTYPLSHALKINEKFGFKIKVLSHFFFKTKKNISGIGKFKNFYLKSQKIKGLESNCKIIHNLSKLEFNKEIFNFQIPTKSKNYILNKYQFHPTFRYKYICEINNNFVNSILILRLVKYNDKKVGRIVEFVGKNKNIIKYNNILFNFISKYKLEYIDFYNYGFSRKHLIKAGFFDKSYFKNIVIPDYFNPYINENIKLNLGILSKENNNFKNLNIFKGDCDYDIPV